MRALAAATAGRTAGAAREIEALAAGSFAALPRDSLYLASLAILGEAAVTCRAADLARPILDELLPYASRNLIQGVPVGWGAAAWHIARLQWLLGRRSDAARSATTAQRLHRQWGAGGLGHPLADLGQQATTASLSRREPEVLMLLACGQANSDVAAALGVSVHTVERHVANIFAKLNVTNRAGATAWAYRRGLVS
jgi:DNA-binding CsgD family transcriptional regulator